MCGIKSLVNLVKITGILIKSIIFLISAILPLCFTPWPKIKIGFFDFSNKFKIFTNVDSATVDPKNFMNESFVDRKSESCIIPPNSFVLAQTVEYFRIPRNVLVICVGKSTYARCGIIVNVTPLEPEWEGHVTLEFSNTTPLPAKIYANEGAAQFLFFEGVETCEKSYADRKGKYMHQTGVTLPKL